MELSHVRWRGIAASSPPMIVHHRTSSKKRKDIHHKQLPPRARAAGLRPVLPRAARRRQQQGARARARLLGDRSIDIRIDRSIDTYISIDRCTTHIDRLGTESISRRTDVARARVCREKKKAKARSQPSSPDDGSDGSERERAADV